MHFERILGRTTRFVCLFENDIERIIFKPLQELNS